MNKNGNLFDNQFTWPISRKLLFLILEDKVSDVFVCELVWERLFYTKQLDSNSWVSSTTTPSYWSIEFNSMSIKEDKLPDVSSPSVNPAIGHLGDPEIK